MFLNFFSKGLINLDFKFYPIVDSSYFKDLEELVEILYILTPLKIQGLLTLTSFNLHDDQQSSLPSSNLFVNNNDNLITNTDSIFLTTYTTPDTKLFYPEPFIASPSFLHEEI
jgi:hypothetical protein